MSVDENPWKRWAGQALAVAAIEVRKFIAGRRWIIPGLLAAAPVSLILMMIFVARTTGRAPGNADLTEMFAVMYQTFILRLMIFFGCALIFSNLYRGDMVTRTLHFYLLSPARREALILGKYLAGFAAAALIFGCSAALTNILIHTVNGAEVAQAHFFAGPGLVQLAAYTGIAVLACAGYGSVFMLTGFLFRNPAIPAASLLLWESANVFLPAALKKISVIHYLQSIVPVPIPVGPFAVITEPASVPVSVFGLFLFTLGVLAVSGLLMRRAEIHYSSD